MKKLSSKTLKPKKYKKRSVVKDDSLRIELMKVSQENCLLRSDINAIKNSQSALEKQVKFIGDNAASSQSISDEMNRLKESVLERFIRIESVLKDSDSYGSAARRFGLK